MKENYDNSVGPQIREAKKGRGLVYPALALTAIVAGLSTATQYVAYKLQYHPALGEHLSNVYPPWAVGIWGHRWYERYDNLFQSAAGIGLGVTGLGFIGILLAQQISKNSTTPNKYLHGSARWAARQDIESAGLLPASQGFLSRCLGKKQVEPTGVFVGAWKDAKGRTRYLRHNGPEHVLTYAPTRSGKGVGLVVPTLLTWPHSAVITDLKGELWAMTAGWRQKYAKNKVIRFEPASSKGGAAWNPLDEIRLGTDQEVGDVQNLATLIVDPDGKGLESHWQKTSQALLVGVILHSLYKAQNEGGTATLQSVDAMLADPERDVGELWMEMTQYAHKDGQNHVAVGSAARDMMDRPDEEGGSVLSTAKSYLALYRDPVVAMNTCRSDFSVRTDLMNADSPVSLYIVTQPSDKARMRPLVRVMLNMIVRMNADKMDFERVDGSLRAKKTYKHRLLGMLDEFPSLGKLEILQESLAFLAGYGIKMYLICQDINQLKSRETGYGPDETITSNCHIQNAYPPNRPETAEHLSKLTGQTTIVKKQVTTSGKRASAMMGQVSTTMQEVQRPLLTVDECLRMPGPQKDSLGMIKKPGDMVVYVAGLPAIYGVQPLFFTDETLAARAGVEHPLVSDTMRKATALSGAERVTL